MFYVSRNKYTSERQMYQISNAGKVFSEIKSIVYNMMIISITLLYWLSVSVRHWGGVTLYSYQMVVTLLSLPIVLLSPHLSTGYIIGAV